MKEKELDYSVDSKIDPNALDVAFLEHADMERLYIEQVGRMKKRIIRATERLKLAEEKVKNTRSKLIQKCHNHPEKCIGKEKATGPEAEAYYRTHPDHLIAKRKQIKKEMKLLQAESNYETAKDMKDLMHFTKTKALESLVTLFGQNYFAGPAVPRNLQRETHKKRLADAGTKSRVKKMAKGLRRNKR